MGMDRTWQWGSVEERDPPSLARVDRQTCLEAGKGAGYTVVHLLISHYGHCRRYKLQRADVAGQTPEPGGGACLCGEDGMRRWGS
jgi:hypothetical protein